MIDTHIHIVSPDRSRYPLSIGYDAKWYHDFPVSAPQLANMMSGAGVDAAILVQGFGPYGYDNSYSVDAANERPDIYRSAVVVDGTLPNASKTLQELAEGGAAGTRLFVTTYDRWGELIATASSLGIVLQIQFQEKDSDLAATFIREFPDAEFILDHCSFAPFERGGDDFSESRWFLDLARAKGAHVKITTINLLAAQKGGRLEALLPRLVEAFGSDRIMWGSNYSESHSLDYAGLVDLFRTACCGLGASDRYNIERGTALKFWPDLRRPADEVAQEFDAKGSAA